ncbi:hypothetical protein AB0912_15520 [Streptomyces sp. NPDC007084]|uniref:hypothetical protein n=1 Tax=Streptomyces sp. NPDC007084 TaxID=3154313 RepID=UPI003453DB2A
MPDTTQSPQARFTPEAGRPRRFLLPQPAPLSATIPTARRAQTLYDGVRGGDSPHIVTGALIGHRTALRQLCDSLQLEHRPVSPAERDARKTLDQFGTVYGSTDPARSTRALEALSDCLERILGDLQDAGLVPGDGR